jgi:beta-N-acetylhexosaminidase
MKFFSFFLFIILFVSSAFMMKQKPLKDVPDFLKHQSLWVDSVYNSLSNQERIAQLFMVAAYSNKDMKHVKEVRELIQNYNIGGLIFMQGGPVRQAKLNNYYQDLAKTPLLISIDGEWGLAMRLDSTPKYPKQMTLGAIQNDSLIFKMGQQVAKECKRMGIHVNFAPVADVNNNPLNPVIGMRSFGEDKYNVANKAIMYMKGMQSMGIMANGKHFPGHGDTESDSHKTLPLINQSKERIDSLELYPFRRLFDEGLSSIMVAHLYVPSLDTTKNRATTLSPYIVNDLLKTQMGFKGLVFTDALNMKGVANYYEPGIVDVKALLAGNDVLLFAENVPKAIEQIKLAIDKGEISQEEINIRCKKILQAKYWCGLNKLQFVDSKKIYEDLNNRESRNINSLLAEASVTLLENKNQLLPLKRLDTLKIAEVSIGEVKANHFSASLNKYTKVDFFGISHDASNAMRDTILSKLKKYNCVIVQVNKTTYKAEKDFGCSAGSIDLISKITTQHQAIVCLFANPYLINKLIDIDKAKALLQLYESNDFSQRAAADAIIGAVKVNGKLPVSTQKYKLKSGLTINEIIRVQYVAPERMGIYLPKLKQIDSIALVGIKEKAYPGCQITAIKNGKVFYQKSFGTLSYDSESNKVTDETIYDLASLTKILSSSLALMKLSEQNQFDYNQKLSYYFPDLVNTNKENIKYIDVLTHQAGLVAWIPFWQRTMDKTYNYKSGYFSNTFSDKYPYQVADKLYITKTYPDSLYKQIIQSKIENEGKYLYSDIGYFFNKRLIEEKTNQPIDAYVKQQFYLPLNLGLTYNPLSIYSKNEIAPTENDTKFRKQLIRGYVHDQAAALIGGVGGHAGLFGNSLDVAIVMQMLLNKGNYGGIQLIDSAIINQYTKSHFTDNRRGLCFDKPEFDDKKDSPVTKECSLKSFGHSGFTGTFAWADPENDLVVVFLSNRVHPDAEDNKLAKLGIRGKIHRTFYEAFKYYLI